MQINRALATLTFVLASFGASAAQAPAPSKILAPGAKVEKLAGDFKFTEGPTADPTATSTSPTSPTTGSSKYDTDGKLTTFMQPSGYANGMSFDGKGHLIAVRRREERTVVDRRRRRRSRPCCSRLQRQAAQRPQRRLGAARRSADLLHRPVLQAQVVEARPEGEPGGRLRLLAAPTSKLTRVDRRPDAAQRHHRHAGRQDALRRRHRRPQDLRLRHQRRRHARQQAAVLRRWAPTA